MILSVAIVDDNLAVRGFRGVQNNKGQTGNLEGDSYRELRLLEEVDSTPELSQRHLARSLGIALGVANLLVRNLVKKGYIRTTRVGWKRWVYVLTPAGMSRKVQLTLGYIERFHDHYRRVRQLLREDLGTHTIRPDSCIAIYGATELAELMFLVLRDMGVTSIDVFDRQGTGGPFLGMPVQSLSALMPEQYVKVAVAFPGDSATPCQELYDRGVSPSQVITLLQDPTPNAVETDDRGAIDEG